MALGTGGYLANLRRTKVGDWKAEDGVDPGQVDWTDVVPLKEVLTGFPRIDLSAGHWEHLRNGRTIPGTVVSQPTVAWFDGLPVAFLEADPKRSGEMKPRKVL